MDSSSSPEVYRWDTWASGSRSPFPASSWTHRSAIGSSAAARASTRTAAVLPLPGARSYEPVDLEQRDGDGTAAGVGAERDVREHVGLPRLGQRPRLRLHLRHVGEPDPQLQAPLMLRGDAFRPHRRQGAAQAGGEFLAALEDRPGGDAVGEVQFGAPSLAVLERVGEEVQAAAAGDEQVVDRLDPDRGEALGDDLQGRLLVARGDDRGGRAASRRGVRGGPGTGTPPRPGPGCPTAARTALPPAPARPRRLRRRRRCGPGLARVFLPSTWARIPSW